MIFAKVLGDSRVPLIEHSRPPLESSVVARGRHHHVDDVREHAARPAHLPVDEGEQGVAVEQRVEWVAVAVNDRRRDRRVRKVHGHGQFAEFEIEIRV